MRMRRFAIVAAPIALLAAAMASASNMAFALRLQLTTSGDQHPHFLALPYQYAPTTAEGLCGDLGGSDVVQNENPWVATVEVGSETIIVGEPFNVHVVITNRSTTEVVMPAPVGLCGRFSGLVMSGPDSPGGEESLGGLPCPAVLPFPVFMTKRTYEPGEKVAIWDTDHYPRHVGTYMFQFSCQAPESVREPQRDFKSGKTEVNSEVWAGHFASNSVLIQAVEPQGIDKQAYEAFGPAVVFDSKGQGELLRRFPTSTYAAYVVWKRTWPGLASVTTDVPLYGMERGPGSFPPISLPCVDPQSAACEDVGFPPTGQEGARRQAAWLDLVLRSHPGIWFADELRFKRAYAAFFLGDKDACEAGLEDLAQHGKPYVASKARELLAAMKAKGMLGEKAK